MKKLLAIVLVLSLVAAAAGAWQITEGDDYILLWKSADYHEGGSLTPPSFGVRIKDGVVEVLVDFGGPKIAYPRDLHIEVLLQIGNEPAEEVEAAVAVGDRMVFLDTSVAIDMLYLESRDVVRVGAWPVEGGSVWGEWRIGDFPNMLWRFVRMRASGREKNL